MKTLLRFSVIRAVGAVVIGILLLKYSEAVLKGLVIVLGVMFLIAGVLSLIGWVNSRRKKPELKALETGDTMEEFSAPQQSVFPIAGLGSLLLGCILSMTQTDSYLDWAMYLVGGVLVLGALNTMMNIVAARKMEPVGGWMWLLPLSIVAASVFAMIRGLVPPEMTTTILGVTALVYAVVELLYSVLFYQISRRYEKTQAQVRRASEAASAADSKVVVATPQ